MLFKNPDASNNNDKNLSLPPVQRESEDSETGAPHDGRNPDP